MGYWALGIIFVNNQKYLRREMNNKKTTLELGTKPIGKLLVQYATPAIIAMTASSLYNMVDSIFIGQGVGAMAISGLAITFPFMNLIGAFGAAIGIGSSASISVRLGQKNYNTAQNIMGNSITLNIISGLMLGVFGLLFLDPILGFFGASSQTLPYAREYMIVILLGSVISHLYFGLNAVLRAASKPKQAMYATMFTVVLNTILDPIFIWPLHMGIKGAAIATVLSQSVAMFWQFRIFSDSSQLLHLKRGIYRLKASLVKEIISIGVSPFAMNACACIVVIFVNTALARYGGDLWVGAYGIANRIGFIFFMVVIGINQGMQPITGYNYGAKHYDRLFKALKYAIMAAISVMTLGWIVGELLPYACARLFTADKTLIGIAERAIRINMIAFPLIGYQAVVTNFFQSIGKAKISIILSLSRQMIFLLPLLIILPPLWGTDGVWWALPISDVIAFIMAFIFMKRYKRRMKRSILKEEQHESQS